MSENITALLKEWSDGDKTALGKLIPLVYKEMRRMAANYLKAERPNHTLQPTALVNEAYLSLVDQREANCKTKTGFLHLAGRSMRRILVKYARDRKRKKRDGELQRITLNEEINIYLEGNIEILALDEALKRLAKLDERKSRIVELRYFSGFSIEETAEALQISPATVKQEWVFIRPWLSEQIRGNGA